MTEEQMEAAMYRSDREQGDEDGSDHSDGSDSDEGISTILSGLSSGLDGSFDSSDDDSDDDSILSGSDGSGDWSS